MKNRKQSVNWQIRSPSLNSLQRRAGRSSSMKAVVEAEERLLLDGVGGLFRRSRGCCVSIL